MKFNSLVPELYVTDFAKSLHFYTKILGFTIVMRALEEYAVANSYPSIQLDYMSVSPWLKKYYEKYGFEETGEVEKWGNIDLIQMRKQLVS